MQDGDHVQLDVHRGEDSQRDGAGRDDDGQGAHALLHPDEEVGGADHHHRRRAHVDHLPVPRQRRAAQDPHRDDE